VLIGLFGVIAVHAQVLVLIRPDRAGPQVDIHSYLHGEWVLWPYRSGGSDLADLWTMTTGQVWAPSEGDPEGLAIAQRRWLGAIGTQGQDLGSLERLRTGPGTTTVTVREVQGWDEVANLARKDRVLVLEYPPRPGQHWSRYWLYGMGWPKGLPSPTGVRGLLPAGSVLSLVAKPTGVSWQDNDTASWGGANRWLEHINFGGPLLLFLMALVTVYASGCALYCLLIEQSGPLAALLIRFAMLGPFAMLGGTWLNLRFGIDQWAAHCLVVWVLLIGLTSLLALTRPLNSVSPLAIAAAVSTLVLLTTPLDWSFLSPVLSQTASRSGALTLGLGASAIVAIHAYLPRPQSMVASVALAFLFAAKIGPSFGLGSLVPIVVGLASWQMPKWTWGSLSLLAAALAVVRHPGGVVFAPEGLIDYADLAKLNLAEYSRFLIGPAFASAVALALGALLLRDKFLHARIRRLWHERPTRASLYRASGLLSICAIVEPVTINAAMVALTTAVCATLHDGVEIPRV